MAVIMISGLALHQVYLIPEWPLQGHNEMAVIMISGLALHQVYLIPEWPL